MLAAENGHKYVVMILAQKEANLDLINKVSFDIHILYENSCISDDIIMLLLSLKTAITSISFF